MASLFVRGDIAVDIKTRRFQYKQDQRWKEMGLCLTGLGNLAEANSVLLVVDGDLQNVIGAS